MGASAPEADTSAGPTASSLLKFTDLTKAFLPPPFFPITQTVRDNSQADHAKHLIPFLEMECVCRISTCSTAENTCNRKVSAGRNAICNMMGSLRTDAWAMPSQHAAVNDNGPILWGLQEESSCFPQRGQCQGRPKGLILPSVSGAIISHYTLKLYMPPACSMRRCHAGE